MKTRKPNRKQICKAASRLGRPIEGGERATRASLIRWLKVPEPFIDWEHDEEGGRNSLDDLWAEIKSMIESSR